MTRLRLRVLQAFAGGLGRLDDDGNLRATADFRGLYGALLEQWLGTDAGAVIPNAARFPPAGDPVTDSGKKPSIPVKNAGIAAVAVAVGLLAAAVPGEAASQGRLLVTAREWSLVTSRQAIKPGPARIQLDNAGEDAHDLRLRRVGGTRSTGIGEAPSLELRERAVRLRGGTWKLWCSLPGHRARGMRATLPVR